MAVQLVRADLTGVTPVYQNLYTVPVGKQFVVSNLYTDIAGTFTTFYIRIGLIETSCVIGNNGNFIENGGFKGLVAQAGEVIEVKSFGLGPYNVMLSGELVDI